MTRLRKAQRGSPRCPAGRRRTPPFGSVARDVLAGALRAGLAQGIDKQDGDAAGLYGRGRYERPSGNARTSSAIRRVDSGASASARSTVDRHAQRLARANGTTIWLAGQLDSARASAHRGQGAASGNPGPAVRICRLTQLTSRPQRRARSCCDNPRPCINSRISRASSMLANWTVLRARQQTKQATG